MSDPAIVPVAGAMASLGMDGESAAALVDGMPLVIAGFNSPRETVVSGPTIAVEAVVEKCRTMGFAAVRLPVTHAFHSPLIAGAVPAFADVLSSSHFAPLKRKVVSTVTGSSLCYKTDLPELLRRQITCPVRFREALAACEDVDLWIEVGPGQILSGLARECGAARTVSLDVGNHTLRGLLSAIGAAFSNGSHIRPESVFADRFTRAIDLDRRPQFLESPCESAPNSGDTATSIAEYKVSQSISEDLVIPEYEELLGSTTLRRNTIDVVRRLVAERAELPLESIQGDHKLLGDLHFNSITVSQLVVSAAKELGLSPPVAPTRYSNVTVAEMAAALEEQTKNPNSVETASRFPPGVDGWVRPFVVEWMECEQTLDSDDHEEDGSWSVFAWTSTLLLRRLREATSKVREPLLPCRQSQVTDPLHC